MSPRTCCVTRSRTKSKCCADQELQAQLVYRGLRSQYYGDAQKPTMGYNPLLYYKDADLRSNKIIKFQKQMFAAIMWDVNSSGSSMIVTPNSCTSVVRPLGHTFVLRSKSIQFVPPKGLTGILMSLRGCEYLNTIFMHNQKVFLKVFT